MKDLSWKCRGKIYFLIKMLEAGLSILSCATFSGRKYLFEKRAFDCLSAVFDGLTLNNVNIVSPSKTTNWQSKARLLNKYLRPEKVSQLNILSYV